jgi:Rieske Fe-S protein
MASMAQDLHPASEATLLDRDGVDDLMVRYMRALLKNGSSDDVSRTCTHCGAHVPFEPDGELGWSTCSACGSLG